MKRYKAHEVFTLPLPNPAGDWVLAIDAEAEIHDRVYDAIIEGHKNVEAAVHRERDRIVTELRDWLGKSKDPSSDWHRGVYDAAEYILTHCYKDFDRSEQKPGA